MNSSARTAELRSGRITLVLFRTRRGDRALRPKRGVGRRVRKSRQKEAAGAADAGLMQIEWGERGVWKFAGVTKIRGGGARTPVQGRVRVEVSLPEEEKKMSGRNGDRLGGRAAKRVEIPSWGCVVSCGSHDEAGWRTELELCCRESFDDRHRPAALGTAPQRVYGGRRRGFRLGWWWNGMESGEA